jgi:hypothetical protein
VVADTVEDGDVGVEEAPHARVTIVTAVAAHHDLVGRWGHGVGDLHVELLFDIEVAALAAAAERDLLVALRRWRGQVLGLREVGHGEEHVWGTRPTSTSATVWPLPVLVESIP